jgi:hypothetical protein
VTVPSPPLPACPRSRPPPRRRRRRRRSDPMRGRIGPTTPRGRGLLRPVRPAPLGGRWGGRCPLDRWSRRRGARRRLRRRRGRAPEPGRLEPAPIRVPALDGAKRGGSGDALAVAPAKVAGHGGRGLPAGEARLGLLAQGGPGPGARALSRLGGAVHPREVGVEGLRAPAAERAVAAPDLEEAPDQVPARPPGQEGRRAVLGTQPDLDPVGKAQALPRSGSRAGADGAAGELSLPGVLVVGARHPQPRMPGHLRPRAHRTCRFTRRGVPIVCPRPGPRRSDGGR